MAEFDERIPIYEQIMDYIKEEMIVGHLRGGDRLPSVREMAEKLKVNPNTVQRAYQELEREGITYTQRGMGSYVTNDGALLQHMKQEKAAGLLRAFIAGMKRIGFSDMEIRHLLERELTTQKEEEKNGASDS